MNLTEKSAYLKGLIDNGDVDFTNKEGKILQAALDLISDMALTISDLEDTVDVLCQQVDLIDEDLEELEDFCYDDEIEDDDDDEFISIDCPNCGDSIYIDDAILKDGELYCPNCEALLEFDICDDCEECDGCCEE